MLNEYQMLANLNSGTILRDRYQLTQIVGQGGMGFVYRAEDIRLPGRLCAVKEVKPEATASPERRKQEHSQFLREASLLAQLDHPNLPKVSDFFTDGGRDYLVMDFVPGKDLKQLLDESRARDRLLEVELVMNWADQLLDALAYLHKQDPPVLHRDIKPANIKLTPDNRIKLVDFGLAKVLATDDSRTITVIQGRGTAYYTPLEQYGAESEHTDVRSDIYALGATLYHLMSGQPPPEAKERFLNPGSLIPLREITRAVTPSVDDTIRWTLEMHPDDRPNDVLTVDSALKGLIPVPTKITKLNQTDSFTEALQANSVPITIAVILLFLALALTVL
jgi:serine/threonine-protein kinase